MSRIEDALAKANEQRNTGVADGKDLHHLLPERNEPAKGKKGWKYGIGLALLLGLGMYYHAASDFHNDRRKPVSAGIAGKSSPAAKQVALSEPPVQENRIPSCILSGSPDPGYSAAHPGWQRYETEALEFRVFRENGTVKAIQVIARREKAISAAVFTSFLKDIAGRESFMVQSRGKKGGSFVERGFAGSRAEVLIYRNKPAGEMNAFVVAYL
jgi:hypothetical protein